MTQKQPYAALFERLRNFLLTPDTLLLTVGSSYRDSHISTVLNEALAMNTNSAVFAFQYQSLETEVCAVELALKRPNLSVYAENGAIISGIPGAWLPGELPKNWSDIRASFWGPRRHGAAPVFLLGDFQYFSRFCALAQASDIRPTAPLDENTPATTVEAVSPIQV